MIKAEPTYKKLTMEQVREIRALAKEMPLTKVAQMYGISFVACRKIAYRRLFAEVKGEPKRQPIVHKAKMMTQHGANIVNLTDVISVEWITPAIEDTL